MAFAFTSKDDRKDLAIVVDKLAAARAEVNALTAALNVARDTAADSTSAKETARADAAEQTLAQRDRQLAETTAALRQMTADKDRLKAQAARVEVVLSQGVRADRQPALRLTMTRTKRANRPRDTYVAALEERLAMREAELKTLTAQLEYARQELIDVRAELGAYVPSRIEATA